MKQYIKDYILEHLDSLDGRTLYVSDIPHDLYADDNMTGSITCNAGRSQENLKEHMDEFEHTVAYVKDNFGDEEAGELSLNLLRSPEKAECCMVFTYVDEVLNRILDHKQYKGQDIWNERLTIDQDFLNWIREHLDEAIDEGFSLMEEYTL